MQAASSSSGAPSPSYSAQFSLNESLGIQNTSTNGAQSAYAQISLIESISVQGNSGSSGGNSSNANPFQALAAQFAAQFQSNFNGVSSSGGSRSMNFLG